MPNKDFWNDEIATGKCNCDYCENAVATHRFYYNVEMSFWQGKAGTKRLCHRCVLLYKFKLSSEGLIKECQVTKIL